jgi:SAM-dependent methyltransferase
VASLAKLEALYRRHHAGTRRPGFVFCEPERTTLFRAWIGSGKDVLDLGCRDGALTAAYLEGNRVVGVDVDRSALAQAERRGIETVWADADEPLPFDDERFDAVVLGELLEHLRFPGEVVTETRRVLRPGGLLVGSVPNTYRLKSRLRFLAGRPPEFADDPTHLRAFRGPDVLDLLAGLQAPEIRYVAGRLVPLWPRLLANDIVFRAWKPR